MPSSSWSDTKQNSPVVDRQTCEELFESYAAALRDYLDSSEEGALSRAYQLGRMAFDKRIGILEFSKIHHRALMTLLEQSEEIKKTVKAAEHFLAQSLSWYEMAQRGYCDTISVLRRFNETLEEQAKCIAHALHDEAGQLLASVHMALADVPKNLPDEVGDRMGRVTSMLHLVEAQLRHLSHELRPTILDDLGLIPALEFLANGVSKRTGLSITVEGSTAGRIPLVIETAIYRICQEALNNVNKHARAARVNIRLSRARDTIHCSTIDDGVGFDVPTTLERTHTSSLGLIGIRERVDALSGTFHLTSTPGAGTKLLITIPVSGGASCSLEPS